MPKTYVHLSKLRDVAWIQDTRKQADRQARIVELFADYRKSTHSIIILRGFKEPDGVQYELIEIPTELFEAVEDLDLASAQLATIPVPVNSVTPYMKIRVDRSDAKITLTGIKLSVCDVHCRWKLESQH